MAAASDSTSNRQSPRSSGFSGDGLNSPRVRRNGRNLSAQWANIVRGESEAVPAAPSSPSLLPTIATQEHTPDSDCSSVKASSSSLPENSASDAQLESSDISESNVDRSKKPAWNKPSNGVVEVSPVMGAVSWPALSESTRASPKSSSDSLKALSDVSSSISQGSAVVSSPKKQSTKIPNPNTTPNHVFPIRQKSMKRANGGFNHPPSPPLPVAEIPQSSSGKPGLLGPDSSPRGHQQKHINSESGSRGGGSMSQPHVGNDNPAHRNSLRRGNGSHYLRNDGSYPNNQWGRGNHEWNNHRSFNGRDAHFHQQRGTSMNLMRPPPNSTPFMNPRPMRPFGNPMSFADMTSPVYYVAAPPPEFMPFIPPPPGIFVPSPDTQLRAMLLKQIDYYFSPANLCKDTYLRQNMDEEGWVPISLIAGFNRVMQLTNNIQFIFDTVRTSTVVELQGDKIRKRNDWINWTLPPSPRPSYDILAMHVQNVGLEDETNNHNDIAPRADAHTEAVLSRSSSIELNRQSQMPSGQGAGHDNVQLSSDLPISDNSEQ